MIWTFAFGLTLGGFVVWWFYISARREVMRIDEEKQLLNQEKQIVLEFMHNMVEAIGERVDRDELFQRVVHAAILSTGALSACVFAKNEEGRFSGVAVEGLFPPQRPLPESSRMKLTTRAKFIEQVLRSEVFAPGEGLIGSVAATGNGVLITDAESDPRVMKHDDPSLVVRSMVVAPIVFRDTALGVLAVANPADGLAFNETDFSLVQSLAEQAGLAIQNADLMNLQIEKNKLDVDLSLASSIQAMLLPSSFPKHRNLDIHACYLPAQKVGGDLFDFFELGEGRIGVVIADVSGKGIPASLIMAICQSNLRHFAAQFDSPARVLSEMNKLMSSDMHKDMFITTVYAIVDTKAGQLVMARAGHELPLHCHFNVDSGLIQATLVGSEGMALGMVPEELFDSVIADKRVDFVEGDIFVLYTDGVTEASNQEGNEFSSGRLADTVKTLRSRPAEELNQGILDSVHRFSGSGQQVDDITLLTVKYVPDQS